MNYFLPHRIYACQYIRKWDPQPKRKGKGHSRHFAVLSVVKK